MSIVRQAALSMSALPFGNEHAEICVIGQCDFATGIGYHTYAFCELLSRSYPTCILPTEGELRTGQSVRLPNGRDIPVCRRVEAVKVAFFVDVVWNGSRDINHLLVPDGALRLAFVPCDGETVPDPWVEILNARFDVAIVPTRHGAALLGPSGVRIPHVVLPLALDIDRILARGHLGRAPKRFRFGSIASFHPRKDPEALLKAFLNAYGARGDVELVLHSNLASGDTLARLRWIVKEWRAANVIISDAPLSENEKQALMDSFDVFVSCSRGEGYSIGPREALASGKVIAVSDIGAHRDIAGAPGVFLIPTYAKVPARYPELDNMTFGEQSSCAVEAIEAALRRSHEHARSLDDVRSSAARQAVAGQFSFSRLATSYAALINTREFQFRRAYARPAIVDFPAPAVAAIAGSLGAHAEKLSHKARRVVRAHDGGFFSVFNSFLSHLVWDLREDRCRMTLPDWDVSRMTPAGGRPDFTSWCYSRMEDGNAWTALFEPLYDLTVAQMADPAFLYTNAVPAKFPNNEDREPLLTYIQAYDLYRTSQFSAWRLQYHRVYKDHVRLLPAIQAEIDQKARHLDAALVVGAHVKHPSHVVEQSTGHIADATDYIQAIRDRVLGRGMRLDSDEWKVFLATDQDRVVRQFVSAFGDRVEFFSDAVRTTATDDEAYDRLTGDERRREGHQVQHLMAADPARRSPRLAVEVIRDAALLARCDLLLHVTSNVSTAVSYMNPDVEMVYCHRAS